MHKSVGPAVAAVCANLRHVDRVLYAYCTKQYYSRGGRSGPLQCDLELFQGKPILEPDG